MRSGSLFNRARNALVARVAQILRARRRHLTDVNRACCRGGVIRLESHRLGLCMASEELGLLAVGVMGDFQIWTEMVVVVVMVVDEMNLWSPCGLEGSKYRAGEKEDLEAQIGKCLKKERRAGQERGSETGCAKF